MDNDDLFNTGWDPYLALQQAEHNIQQCALAINNCTEIMKQLANRVNHQDFVISQLSERCLHLGEVTKQQRRQLDRYQSELEKTQQNTSQ